MVPFLIVNKIKDIIRDGTCLLLLFTFFYICNPITSYGRGIEFKPGQTFSIIPFTNSNGLIIVPFKIGKEEVNLILDSGIRGIILFDKTGSYGLKSEPDLEILFSGIGDGRSIKGKLFGEITLDGPGIVGTGLAVVLLKENSLSKNSNMEVNGLIGYDIFSKFLVTIDYKNSELILMDSQNFNPGNLFQQMDLILVDTKPFVKSNILSEGIEGNYTFFVDTGASFDLVLNQDPFKGKSKKRNIFIGRGLTGEIRGNLHLIKDFYFNNLYLNNFSIAIPTSGVYLNKDLMSERDGTLGGKFLQRFDEVVFDYANNKIYFKTNQLFASNEK